VAAASGQFRAHDVWANINVSDGRLDLDMQPIAGSAAIKAISIYNIGSCQPGAPTATATPAFTLRINAGGPAYAGSDGRAWQADQMYVSGGWVRLAAPHTATPRPSSAQTMRRSTKPRWWDGDGGYRATVPNGTYQVALRFAEIYQPAVIGSRILDVRVEGVVMRANVDVMYAVGKYRAYDLTFSNVVVADGVLNLDLLRRAGSPAVSAIEIVQQPLSGERRQRLPLHAHAGGDCRARQHTVRVNAGGVAYDDERSGVWSPDQAYTQEAGVTWGRGRQYCGCHRQY